MCSDLITFMYIALRLNLYSIIQVQFLILLMFFFFAECWREENQVTHMKSDQYLRCSYFLCLFLFSITSPGQRECLCMIHCTQKSTGYLWVEYNIVI